MIFVSLTRLRIRSIRFLPQFVVHTLRSRRQIRQASGYQTGSLLADRSWTFWTMTAWDNQESMRRYMISGAHKKAMPYLLEWCDEASVTHWEQADKALPPWHEADRRMRQTGRPSKIHHPSPNQATLQYRVPRTTSAVRL